MNLVHWNNVHIPVPAGMTATQGADSITIEGTLTDRLNITDRYHRVKFFLVGTNGGGPGYLARMCTVSEKYNVWYDGVPHKRGLGGKRLTSGVILELLKEG